MAIPRAVRGSVLPVRSEPVQGPPLQVAIGLGIAIIAAAIRLALTPAFGFDLAYITFYPAVAAAAWAAGLLGGLSAVAGSAVIAILLVLQPVGSLEVIDALGLAIFTVSSCLIAALGGQMHRARRLAESGRARAAFLADASAVLAERLGQIPTIDALTRVAVPAFADWCAIDLFDERGTFIDSRIAAPDEAKAELARHIRREYPYAPDAPAGVPAVFRTGVPESVLDMPDDFMATIEDRRLRELMEGLRLRSYISVPLEATTGRRLGVLSVVMSESGRRFSQEDVQTAVELGRRAGVALDHARLYEELAARRDELDAVVQAMADPVLVAGQDGLIRSHNAAAEAVLGDPGNGSLDEVLGGLQAVPGRASVRRVAATGRFVQPAVIEVHTGGSRNRIAVLRDVTAVLESEAARDAFVGMLSHEIRTPITTIYGTAQVLRRPLEGEARASLVDDLAIETERLYRLVEDLLVLSRFEQGRLEVAAEPVLAQRVVNAALSRAASLYPKLRITVHGPPALPPVTADSTYLEQIIRNLVSNAVKYAGEAAHITVRLAAEPDALTIEFEDDGPGIPETETERVFALYERLGDHGVLPGAGIGLFVCRRLVETMGGTMRVMRGAAGGACFSFTLPTLQEVVPSPEPPSGGNGRREAGGVTTA